MELPKKLSKIRIYAQQLAAEPTRPGSRSTMTSFGKFGNAQTPQRTNSHLEPADASRSESSVSNVTLIGSGKTLHRTHK